MPNEHTVEIERAGATLAVLKMFKKGSMLCYQANLHTTLGPVVLTAEVSEPIAEMARAVGEKKFRDWQEMLEQMYGPPEGASAAPQVGAAYTGLQGNGSYASTLTPEWAARVQRLGAFKPEQSSQVQLMQRDIGEPATGWGLGDVFGSAARAISSAVNTAKPMLTGQALHPFAMLADTTPDVQSIVLSLMSSAGDRAAAQKLESFAAHPGIHPYVVAARQIAGAHPEAVGKIIARYAQNPQAHGALMHAVEYLKQHHPRAGVTAVWSRAMDQHHQAARGGSHGAGVPAQGVVMEPGQKPVAASPHYLLGQGLGPLSGLSPERRQAFEAALKARQAMARGPSVGAFCAEAYNAIGAYQPMFVGAEVVAAKATPAQTLKDSPTTHAASSVAARHLALKVDGVARYLPKGHADLLCAVVEKIGHALRVLTMCEQDPRVARATAKHLRTGTPEARSLAEAMKTAKQLRDTGVAPLSPLPTAA